MLGAITRFTGAAVVIGAFVLGQSASVAAGHEAAVSLKTLTPIKHLVVIFPENESFDHYFGTYPHALNPRGEPSFKPRPHTPKIRGLTPALRKKNPNQYNPFRLSRRHAGVCNMEGFYPGEQKAYNGRRVNRFVQAIEKIAHSKAKPGWFCPKGIVMSYYDGNTVTALWNYAQHFAMSDESYGATFGQSTPGALNLTAGTTSGVRCGPKKLVVGKVPACSAAAVFENKARKQPTGTLIADADPYYDNCSKAKPARLAISGRNVGDLLTIASVSWGWFQGGFGNCAAKHPDIAWDRYLGIDPGKDKRTLQRDYVPHHEPFQYFASTSNPDHVPPSSISMVGHPDSANHQYDLLDFWAAASRGSIPAVSFLKPAGYQDGHPGRSDALDEQTFLVDTINRLQRLKQWNSMAIVIAYDDSDGWYDHVRPPIVNTSATKFDQECGTKSSGPPGRCGFGPRLPFLVISRYARDNFVSHRVIDQASITRFMEDNWLHGKRVSNVSFDRKSASILNVFDFRHPRKTRLFLNPVSGKVE